MHSNLDYHICTAMTLYVGHLQMIRNSDYYKCTIPKDTDLTKLDYLIVQKNNKTQLTNIVFDKPYDTHNIELKIYREYEEYDVYKIDTQYYYNNYAIKDPLCCRIYCDDNVIGITITFVNIYVSINERSKLIKNNEILHYNIVMRKKIKKNDANIAEHKCEMVHANNIFLYSYPETERNYLIKPNCLTIEPLNDKMDIDGTLQIICGGNIIFQHTLRFMIALDSANYISNKCIYIPISYWIRYYLMEMQEMSVFITNPKNIKNVILTSKTIARNKNIKGENGDNLICDQLEYHETILEMTNKREYYINLSSCTYSIGLFIYCDTNDLLSIKLLIQNNPFINYDKILIDLYCDKISDNMIYVPFDLDKNNYTDFFTKKYTNGINFSDFLSSSLMLKFGTIQKYICISNRAPCRIMYKNGICSITKRDKRF